MIVLNYIYNFKAQSMKRYAESLIGGDSAPPNLHEGVSPPSTIFMHITNLQTPNDKQLAMSLGVSCL